MRRARGDARHLWLALSLLILAAMPVAADENKEGEEQMAAEKSLSIRWFGQACFAFTDNEGLCVLNDPFPEGFGYPSPDAEPRVCLISHEHKGHNSVENVKGRPTVLRGVGTHEAAGLQFTGIATFHDSEGGAKRGPNTVFCWEMAGVRIVHLGDLGHELSDEQVEQIGRVDVLAIPVGGYYTIDAAQAVTTATRLGARVVLPMHYRTSAVPRLPIGTVEDFLAALPADWKVEKPETPTVALRATDLAGDSVRVIVLPYE